MQNRNCILERMVINTEINTLISGIFALAGAVIGATATIFSGWVNKKMQSAGDVFLYAKIVHSRVDICNRTWGFWMTDKGLSFHVPLWIDICNTTSISKIIRNVSLHLMRENSIVGDFTQIQGNSNNPKDASAIMLGDNGAYTFVVPANSVLRVELEFSLLECNLNKEKTFDSIYLSYYDEKNNIHVFQLANLNVNWTEGTIQRIEEWITLEERKRKGSVAYARL